MRKMKPEETLDFPIRWAWFRIARMYNTEATKHGGSMSTGYVLLNIDLEEGTPSTKLGPKMGMEPRSLTRTLKSMEEKGLIYRRSDPNDGRMVRIMLTEEGQKMRELSKAVVLQFNFFVQNKISKKKLKVFFEVMTDINKILDDNNIFTEIEEA